MLDTAQLAFAAGYEMTFDAKVEAAVVEGEDGRDRVRDNQSRLKRDRLWRSTGRDLGP